MRISDGSSDVCSSDLVVQAPRGVDEEEVVAGRLGGLHGGEGEARRIGALVAGDHRAAGALAPDLKLLDGGCAEGVAGGETHLEALATVVARQLADGGGLAGAVYHPHHHPVRIPRRVEAGGLRTRLGNPGD